MQTVNGRGFRPGTVDQLDSSAGPRRRTTAGDLRLRRFFSGGVPINRILEKNNRRAQYEPGGIKSIDVGTRQNPDNGAMNDQYIRVYRNFLTTDITLSGIGATRNASGSTTGAGLNTICYNSSGITQGVEC